MDRRGLGIPRMHGVIKEKHLVESGLGLVGREEKSAVQAGSNGMWRCRNRVTKILSDSVLAQMEGRNGTFRSWLKAKKSKTLGIEGEAFFHTW